MGYKTKTEQVATTDALMPVEIVDASVQWNGKLKRLQQNCTLNLSEADNLRF